MRLRSPWVGVLAAVGCGLLLVLTRGSPGLQNLLGIVVLVCGLAGPVVAAVRMGREAIASRPHRLRLLLLLAIFGGGAIALGWWGLAGTGQIFAILFCGMGVAATFVLAMLASAAARPSRPGREGFENLARPLWTIVLAGGVLYFSLPIGWGFRVLAVRRAKRWVEAAASEVRAMEKARGRSPSNLVEILPRVGAPPRLVPEDGGYSVGRETGSFEFRIEDPSQFLPGDWVYSGRTGEWEREFF